MAKFVWTPSDGFNGTLAFDYTKSDENGSPLVFAASTRRRPSRASRASTPAARAQDSASPPVPDSRCRWSQDDRCANDLQARGPFGNNGTLPL